MSLAIFFSRIFETEFLNVPDFHRDAADEQQVDDVDAAAVVDAERDLESKQPPKPAALTNVESYSGSKREEEQEEEVRVLQMERRECTLAKVDGVLKLVPMAKKAKEEKKRKHIVRPRILSRDRKQEEAEGERESELWKTNTPAVKKQSSSSSCAPAANKKTIEFGSGITAVKMLSGVVVSPVINMADDGEEEEVPALSTVRKKEDSSFSYSSALSVPSISQLLSGQKASFSPSVITLSPVEGPSTSSAPSSSGVTKSNVVCEKAWQEAEVIELSSDSD